MSKSVEDQLKALANTYKTITTASATPAASNKISASVGQGGKNVKADVITVQTLLNKKGAKLTVDGSCGPKTIAAITAFQKQVVKLAKPDGRIDVGGATWKALTAGATATPAPTTPTPAPAPSTPATSNKITASVGQGGKNVKADVITVQTLLNKKGAKLTVDGSCGPKTIAAITAFQKQIVKLASPDGRIDPGGKTWTALNGNSGSITNTPAPAPQQPTTGGGNAGTGAEPSWIKTAKSQIGVKENKSKTVHNPEVVKYFAATPVANAFKNDDAHWCSAFTFWCMKQNGYTGPTGDGGYDSVRALKWANWGKKLSKPAFGAIGVMKRSGGGHVGFVTGAANGKITMLGGNQGDMVKYSNFNASDFVAFVVPNNYEVPAAAYNLTAGNGSEGDSMS